MTTTAATTSPVKTRTTNLREWQAAAQERISLLVVPVKLQPTRLDATQAGGIGGMYFPISDGDWAWPHSPGPGYRISNNPNGPDGWVEEYSPFRIGDVLIGKETFALRADVDPASERKKALHYIVYRADREPGDDLSSDWHNYTPGWRSAQTMPAWAARFRRPILSVAVKQVQDVTEAEAIACGIPRKLINDPMFKPDAVEYGALGIWGMQPRTSFEWLWNEAHRAFPWKSDPWVWLIGVAANGASH